MPWRKAAIHLPPGYSNTSRPVAVGVNKQDGAGQLLKSPRREFGPVSGPEASADYDPGGPKQPVFELVVN